MTKIPETVQRRAKIALARRDFWTFCKLIGSDFYRDDRPYLKKLCHDLQDFLESDERVLVINAPPRHGKSRTAENFVAWALGKDKSRKIMTASYNETLAQRFSKDIRGMIQTEKIENQTIVYNDIFPDTQIQKGEGAVGMWSLEGQHVSYIATSPGGTATGLGADIIIVDDLIKNEFEARNDRVKESHWLWFTGTMLQRLEHGKLIVIMTRWASDDFAGRIIDRYSKDKTWKLKHICLTAIQPDGSMLCDDILNREDYKSISDSMGPEITEANYQQRPIDLRGRLYSEFQTYDTLPTDANGHLLFTARKSYTDTADTGSDFLCHIQYGVYRGLCYITDVLYTQDSMEKTEPETARLLIAGGIKEAHIESNNGGRGFARQVKKIVGGRCTIIPFTQHKNKMARILSNATLVMSTVRFPSDWVTRWPEFAKALLRYQREGKNAHDDAPDALTGVVETMGQASVRAIRGSL